MYVENSIRRHLEVALSEIPFPALWIKFCKLPKGLKIIGGILGWCTDGSCLCTISNTTTSNGQNVPQIYGKNKRNVKPKCSKNSNKVVITVALENRTSARQ